MIYTMTKGIDGMFVNYGIRKEDMDTIMAICHKNDLDFEWVKESILKEFHVKRVDSAELADSVVESVIKNAIKQIK